MGKLSSTLLFVYVVSSAVAGHGGLLPAANVFPPATIRNTHTAISHQSFTRLHNEPLLTPAVAHSLSGLQTRVPPVGIAVQSLPVVPHAYVVAASMPDNAHTPVIKTLTHTPAHLTYAAAPIVYKTLLDIKPVRSIRYGAPIPSPHANGYY